MSQINIECSDLTCPRCHPPEVRCARCENVIPRRSYDNNLDGGMEVAFRGWNGGTIDPSVALTWGSDGYIHTFLCDRCAKTLLSENRWLSRVDQDFSVLTT